MTAEVRPLPGIASQAALGEAPHSLLGHPWSARQLRSRPGLAGTSRTRVRVGLEQRRYNRSKGWLAINGEQIQAKLLVQESYAVGDCLPSTERDLVPAGAVSAGRKTRLSVTIAVINRAGVTSKAGLSAGVPAGAVEIPRQLVTSSSFRYSITIEPP
jgi:hypothetical protein